MDLETAQRIRDARFIAGSDFVAELQAVAEADSPEMAKWWQENLTSGDIHTRAGWLSSERRSLLGIDVDRAYRVVLDEARRVIADEKDRRIDLALRRVGEVIPVEIPGTLKWAKTVTGISYDKGVFAYDGESLKPGQVVNLPIGTLFLCYHTKKYATLHVVVPAPGGGGQELVAYSSVKDWPTALRPEIRNWLVKTGKRV